MVTRCGPGPVPPAARRSRPGAEDGQVGPGEAPVQPGQLVPLVEGSRGRGTRARGQPGRRVRPASRAGGRSTKASGQSRWVGPVPRSTRWTSTSSHRRSGQFGQRALAARLASRVTPAQAWSGASAHASSMRADDIGEVGERGRRPVGRHRPRSRRPARPAPPGYWSTTMPSMAAAVRRVWLSALRARWVSRWPTVHPGSSDGAGTAASSNPATTASRRTSASRTAARASTGGRGWRRHARTTYAAVVTRPCPCLGAAPLNGPVTSSVTQPP